MGDVDCNQALERLYTFLDGELDDARRADISEHLDKCAPCLGLSDFERDLRHVVAQSCLEEVPEELRARIAAVIARGE